MAGPSEHSLRRGVGGSIYEAAGEVAEKAHEAKSALKDSQAAQFVRRASDRIADAASAAGATAGGFLQRHPQVKTFATLWALFAGLPFLIWIGANVGVVLATLGVAAATLLTVNGVFMLATSGVLGFVLFFTTIGAAIAYFWVFLYGVVADLARRAYRYVTTTTDEAMERGK